MLVALREITKEEIACKHDTQDRGVYERYYSLYTNDSSATVVDVTDNRARRTFNYDVRVTNNSQLLDIVLLPLLQTILEPQKACQAVVVADGTRDAREATLFGRETGASGTRGAIAECFHAIRAQPAVSSIYFASVTLDDENRLVDGYGESPGDTVTDGGAQPTVLEDTKDRFTAIEEARYEEINEDAALERTLRHLRAGLSDTKHQVYSFIIAFDEKTEMPNTTLQFVSFAVGELARGMKSTRHCVSTAASLIECRSPVMPFAGTKISFLLKPALLGDQPGVWVSCLSPISFIPEDPFVNFDASPTQTPGLPRKESFKEAFSVAQLASRIYSSRIGVAAPSLPQLPPTQSSDAATAEERKYFTPSVAAAETSHRRGATKTDEHSAKFLTPSDRSSGSAADAQRQAADAISFSSAAADDVQPWPDRRGHGVDVGLVSTPSLPRKSDGPQRANAAAGTPSATPDHQAGRSSAAYEYETYKHVMEHAMDKLRGDVREYARKLEEANAEAARLRKQHSSHGAAADERERVVVKLQADCAALVAERDSLREQLRERDGVHEQRLRETQAEANASQLRLAAEMGTALTKLNESQVSREAVSEELTVLRARVSELIELVGYHQQEIQEHVEKEKAYRERVLSLEDALRSSKRDADILRTSLQATKKELSTATSARQSKNASVSEEARRVQPASSVDEDERDSLSGDEADFLHTSKDAMSTEMARKLQEALLIAERERKRRAALEKEMTALRGESGRTDKGSRQLTQQERVLVAEAQSRYEEQLQGLQEEMQEFKSKLQQQEQQRTVDASAASPTAPQTASIRVLSSTRGQDSYAVLDDARQQQSFEQRRAHDGSALLSPPSAQGPTAVSSAAPRDEASVLSSRSTGSARRSWRPRAQGRSFEDFMREDPEYHIREGYGTNPRPRRARLNF